MAKEKEKETVLHVLEMYKHMPFLWDKNHVEYKNRVSRTNAHRLLLQVYQKFDETATVQSLNKKIQNLRTSYLKEFHKVKKSRRNAVDEEEIYEPSLWYYDALSFLGDYCESSTMDPIRIERSSISSSDDERSCHNSETNDEPPSNKRKFTNPIVYKDSNRSTETTEEGPQMKAEEWEIFGKCIGLQLKDLDKKQLTIAQKLISDSIYYAKFNLLTPNSYIHIENQPPPI